MVLLSRIRCRTSRLRAALLGNFDTAAPLATPQNGDRFERAPIIRSAGRGHNAQRNEREGTISSRLLLAKFGLYGRPMAYVPRLLKLVGVMNALKNVPAGIRSSKQ